MGKAWLGLLALCTYGIAFSAVVTTPVGVLNNPGATLASDPFAPDTWMRRNVRFDGSVGITGNYPRSGNGSVWLSLGANTGAGGKADWEYVPSLTFGLLGQLGTVSYEWYRDGASTVPAHLHPVLRLMVDADGNLGTTTDVGYLIFERCYNLSGCPAVPVNTWTTENITGTTILWWFQIGVGVEPVFTRTLATYQAGAYTPTPGFAQLSGSSLVFG
ncbi:MAG: hypothetical protein NZ869_11085, partial [Thermoanaerobaculum sp.]|nr:hypothetical protein [Thermoanaerobaculum sp.]